MKLKIFSCQPKEFPFARMKLNSLHRLINSTHKRYEEKFSSLKKKKKKIKKNENERKIM